MSTFSVGSVVGSIGGVARAASNVADDILGLVGGSDGSWQRSLKPASYGGINFGVISSTTSGIGRKVVVHEYPERDEVWVEDLGKKSRRFSVTGFLVENDVVYNSGPVIAQRDALVAVLDTRFDQVKPGLQLVHPTFGNIPNVCCINCEILEHADHGGYFELRFDFIISGARKYPASSTSTAGAVADGAKKVREASALDYIRDVAAAVKQGAAIVKQAIRVAVAFYTKVLTLINDVRRVFRAISNLGGNFGSLFGGANAGYSARNASAPQGATAASLLAADTASRTAVANAGAALTAAAANPADGASLSSAAIAVAQSLAATASDPADGVRLLSSMAQYVPADPTTDSQVGVAMAQVQSAMGALFRRAALAQLAEVTSSYQPSSSEDALAVRGSVAGLIADEMQVAGDAGDDDSYLALMELRAAVIADLTSRGAQLSAMQEFRFRAPLNSLALAYRVYRDAGRATELVQQAQPVHPAFMPMDFKALGE
ncbi:MAG: hypothetical protein GAK35_03543 [Herbaspirillum frisingense]|uniref:DNA circulation N-terminal domain-containing protein n=1 Tax=Herbaspirillum frisingense TaxID=92645 RepID=A0A7V8JSR6_9BURK|nr:MAG: hypothetical protein GAK35_03543 [Herbaspirillum frisingense]